MSEQAPKGPLDEGLTYTTFVQAGRMLHVGADHLIVANTETGNVSSFTWDEVIFGLALAQKHQAARAIEQLKQDRPPTLVETRPNSRLARFLAKR